MSTFIDFEDVKNNHRIEDVAKALGLELKKSGNQLRGACFSGAEGDRKLVITPDKQVWYSFALNEGGDVLKLVSLVRQCSVKEAAQWLEPEKSQRTERSPSLEGSERGFAPLDYLEADHPAVDALGFDTETATTLGIGWAPRGLMKNTVAIPIRNADGTLVGYIGVQDPIKLPPSWKL